MSTSTSSPPSPLRILFLHGYTQTPTLFRHKTAALTKHLRKLLPHHNLSFSYPAGPIKLDPADIPGYQADPLHQKPLPKDEGFGEGNTSAGDDRGKIEACAWWRRRDVLVPTTKASGRRDLVGAGVNEPGAGGDAETEIVYEGLEEGMEAIARCIRAEGPFDGVVGMSQGAAAAAMVASLLEEGREGAFARNVEGGHGGIPFPGAFQGLARADHEDGFTGQPPLKFCVAYSGFCAPGERYRAFYEPRIRTPILHVLGAVDVIVEEKRSRLLVEANEGGEERVVVHPGGHFVPSGRPWLDAVGGFVKGCVVASGTKAKGEEKEESVEDMDVPF